MLTSPSNYQLQFIMCVPYKTHSIKYRMRKEGILRSANITRIFYLLMLILSLIHFMYKIYIRRVLIPYTIIMCVSSSSSIQRVVVGGTFFFVFISFWFNAANSLKKIYIFYVLLLFDSSSCLGLQLVEITAAATTIYISVVRFFCVLFIFYYFRL